MRVLITILDNITETSMPFNEFVLYRANHFRDEKQILIICGSKSDLPKVDIPKDLIIKYVGRNLLFIRKTIKEIINDLNKQGIPYVFHLHQVQSGFLAECAMIGTGFRKKVLFTVHSTFSGYKFHNKVLSFINALYAQQITCVSNTSYQDYPRIIKRIKGKRIQPLQNGVDTERIDSIISVNQRVKNDYVNFIYVARLIPLKNHSFLVDVLSRCDKNIRFIFVGTEDKDKVIRSKAKTLGVHDRINFTGLIPRNEVFKELRFADYYISSSTLEGLPVSVLEAMYCGLPCVLSDIPQHKEIANEDTILLSCDVDKWKDVINRLAILTEEEKTEKSKRIRQYVEDNFSLRTMHKKYDVIYETL